MPKSIVDASKVQEWAYDLDIYNQLPPAGADEVSKIPELPVVPEPETDSSKTKPEV